jgi:hypothetical protein
MVVLQRVLLGDAFFDGVIFMKMGDHNTRLCESLYVLARKRVRRRSENPCVWKRGKTIFPVPSRKKNENKIAWSRRRCVV